MTDLEAQVAIGFSVISVTRYLMERYSLSHEDAFKKLIATEFYEILADAESDLCLEPAWYIRKACRLELDEGRDAMIRFINDY